MDGLGHFIASLFSRPRLTWAALAISAALFLVLPNFGMKFSASEGLVQIATLSAWIVFLLSTVFFLLTIGIDGWATIQRNAAEKSSAKKSLDRFRALPPGARAIAIYMVMNSENSIWIMNDYAGLQDFIASSFGYISSKDESAVEIEMYNSDYTWVRVNLNSFTGEDVGPNSRQILFESMKRAREEITGMRA